MLYEAIKKLVQYGVETGLTPACEKNHSGIRKNLYNESSSGSVPRR